MRIEDIVLVDGSFRDTLSANAALDDCDRCVEICVLLGVPMSDAEQYFEVIRGAPGRRSVPSSQRDYGRELIEDRLMDMVEMRCLQTLCNLQNTCPVVLNNI